MSSIITAVETFGLSADMGMTGEGPTARRKRVRNDQRMRRAMVEAHTLLTDAWAGDRVATLRVNEAITTSDLFKSAAGEVFDRELLASYEAQPTQWTKFARRTTVRNFKPKYLRELLAGSASLPLVPEHTNYPEAKADLRESHLTVKKFGEQFGYTFEARINDEIGELQIVPGSWANKARYTEDDAAIAMLADPITGAPNAAFFNATNQNLGTGALTAARLQAALEALSQKRDPSGRLLRSGPLQLVVGPALAFTAERIMNTSEIQTRNNPAAGTVDISTVIEGNPFRGKVSLTVLDNLPGNAWFIIPAPSAPRPAFYVGFLAGYETPDMRYKADQGNSLGGGSLSADAGSFDDDTIYYRVRHIVGAATGDPKFTYASDGA